MDDLDRSIVAQLAADARVSLATLARRLKVARSTLQSRLERLESSGVITGYTVKLGEIGQRGRIRAIVLLTIDLRMQVGIVNRLKAMPEVETIHSTSGRVDLILSVAAATTQGIDQVLDMIGAVQGVRDSESFIQLTTKLDRAVAAGPGEAAAAG